MIGSRLLRSRWRRCRNRPARCRPSYGCCPCTPKPGRPRWESRDAGSTLALQRADGDLARALDQAPWIAPAQGSALRTQLHGVERAASARAATPAFAADVNRLATDIDRAFGLTPQPCFSSATGQQGGGLVQG